VLLEAVVSQSHKGVCRRGFLCGRLTSVSGSDLMFVLLAQGVAVVARCFSTMSLKRLASAEMVETQLPATSALAVAVAIVLEVPKAQLG
jgi:hypothetical protein